MTKGNPLEMKHTLKTEWLLGTVYGVITLAAAGLGRGFGKIEHSSLREKLIVWAAALVLLIAGSNAIVHFREQSEEPSRDSPRSAREQAFA